ncbi:Stealth CR1 domain-containing protein, partial [Streptomyces sp. G-G2]|uniref:Stealth CR1 domain-containing protein n=1 Tax=Streptomyces sp. G-G2 TaxID=3046201 RepID=UPI0024BA3213
MRGISAISRRLRWTGLPRLVRVLRPSARVPRQPGPAERERTEATAVATATARPPDREDELLAVLAPAEGAVRYRGRLALVRDDLLPADVRAANLRAAAEALESAGIGYGLVPDGGLLHRLAIAPGVRETALKACAEAFTGRPVYAELLGDGGTLAVTLAEDLPAAVAAMEAETAPGPGAARTPAPGASDEQGEGDDRAPQHKVKGIRLHQPVVTSGRTLYLGADHGCDLEFWEPPESGSGGVASIRETPFGWWVPSLAATVTRRVGDREYPVVDALARRFPDDIDFPIDAVVTWVDAADPAWRRRREQARAEYAEDTGHPPPPPRARPPPRP